MAGPLLACALLVACEPSSNCFRTQTWIDELSDPTRLSPAAPGAWHALRFETLADQPHQAYYSVSFDAVELDPEVSGPPEIRLTLQQDDADAVAVSPAWTGSWQQLSWEGDCVEGAPCVQEASARLELMEGSQVELTGWVSVELDWIEPLCSQENPPTAVVELD